MKTKQRELTAKQQLFIYHYLDTLNGVKAAKRAGYKGSYSTLGVVAHENLKKPKIKKAIQDGLIEMAMSEEEVVARISELAKVNLSDFIIESEDGFKLNWKEIEKKGYLIKGITHTQQGIKLDLHDSLKALIQLGRLYALFTDRVEFDWEREALEAGLSPGELFEKLVQYIVSIRSSDQKITE